MVRTRTANENKNRGACFCHPTKIHPRNPNCSLDFIFSTNPNSRIGNFLEWDISSITFFLTFKVHFKHDRTTTTGKSLNRSFTFTSSILIRVHTFPHFITPPGSPIRHTFDYSFRKGRPKSIFKIALKLS